MSLIPKTTSTVTPFSRLICWGTFAVTAVTATQMSLMTFIHSSIHLFNHNFSSLICWGTFAVAALTQPYKWMQCYQQKISHYVAPACCKDNYASQWKNLKFDSHHTKVTELTITQLCLGNYIGEPYPHAKCDHNPYRGFAEWVNLSLFSLFFICGYFQLITTETVAPILTLNMSNNNNTSLFCMLSRFGCRSFRVSGPTIWNDLTVDFRSTDITREQFKRSLKTWLFECAYGRRRVWETVQSEGAPKKWTYLLTYLLTRMNLLGVPLMLPI